MRIIRRVVKKGKVYGQEKAFGIDTYVGDFRKGLPDAKGTYTWSNGDKYIGHVLK